MERWIDQILARMPHEIESQEYCFSSDQIADSRRIRQGDINDLSDRLWWSLLLAGLRGNISGQLDRRPNSPRLNALIAQQVLGMFSSDYFDDFGLLKSVRRQAVEATISDSDTQEATSSFELKSPLHKLLSKKREIQWMKRLP